MIAEHIFHCSPDVFAEYAATPARLWIPVHSRSPSVRADLVLTLPLGKKQGVDSEESFHRSEERRVGKECVSTCRSRWSTYNSKKKHTKSERTTLINKAQPQLKMNKTKQK